MGKAKVKPQAFSLDSPRLCGHRLRFRTSITLRFLQTVAIQMLPRTAASRRIFARWATGS